MGLFDNNANDPFSSWYDFNHDGKLDPMERSFRDADFMKMTSKKKKESNNEKPQTNALVNFFIIVTMLLVFVIAVIVAIPYKFVLPIIVVVGIAIVARVRMIIK